MRMLRRDGGSVIAGEHDEGALPQSLLIHRLHEAAKGAVHLRDVAVVGGVGRIVGGVESGVFFR